MQIVLIVRRLCAVLLITLLAACASERGPNAGKPAGKGGEAPVGTPTYKVGQPYQINGNWYYPREDYSYDETGIASWYGEDFHGERTANGEIYNMDELTAAHKTLPLPSLARVTNLENGHSIVVRVNDRGPFSGARIIDLSKRAADLLGFRQKGTAKVRVQVLADESKAIADALRHYGSSTPPTEMLASASGMVQTAPLEPVTSQPLPPSMQAGKPATLASVKPVAEVKQVVVTGANLIYVQAGAFTNLDNANNLQKRLSKLGKVAVKEAVVNGIKFYRVRVGPIADVPAADAMIHQVGRSGIHGARTIVE